MRDGAPNPTFPQSPLPPPPIAHLSYTQFSFPQTAPDMSQSSSPSTFRYLFNAALQDYKDKPGKSLVDHPFAKQLQECDSVQSVSTILEEQALVFREFRDHGKAHQLAQEFRLASCARLLSAPFLARVST